MNDSPAFLVAAGYDARRLHRADEALMLFAQAAEMARNGEDRALLAQALTGLGQIERDLHHTEVAKAHYEEAVTILRTLGDPLRLAHTVRHVGDILLEQEFPEQAAPQHEEALAIYRAQEATGTLDLANAIAGYARTLQALGRRSEASTLWKEAREYYESLAIQTGVDEADARLNVLGQA